MQNAEKPSWGRHLARVAVGFLAGVLVALGIAMLKERAHAAVTEAQ